VSVVCLCSSSGITGQLNLESSELGQRFSSSRRLEKNSNQLSWTNEVIVIAVRVFQLDRLGEVGSGNRWEESEEVVGTTHTLLHKLSFTTFECNGLLARFRS
jgi:hypothetical protein